MPPQLIPPWAPNLHPMVVHFPIVLVILACGADVVLALGRRARGRASVAVGLYLLGAVAAAAAYISGQLAADTVFIPGMAHGLVDDHGRWALAATLAVVLTAAARLAVHLGGRGAGRGVRLFFAAAGLVIVLLVQQTAERGARLVYEQGVGVIPGPVAPPPPVGDTAPPPR